jgi:heme-degrading monooxygenase HmoA
VNIAVGRGLLEAPVMADFAAALDPVNARADRAPGFVWRMQNDDGNATSVRGFGGDPRLIISLTVWESLEALRSFVYRDPEHLNVMRRRREWFERLDLYMVLWWVPSGHRPSVEEAERRLDLLREQGPTPAAFTFRASFDTPQSENQRIDDEWLCPA